MTTSDTIVYEDDNIVIIDEQSHHAQLGWFGGIYRYEKTPLVSFPHDGDDYAIDNWENGLPLGAIEAVKKLKSFPHPNAIDPIVTSVGTKDKLIEIIKSCTTVDDTHIDQMGDDELAKLWYQRFPLG